MLPGLSSMGSAASSSGIQFVGSATAGNAGTTSNTTIAINSGLSGGIASAAQDGDLVVAVYATGSDVDVSLSITDGSNNYTLIGSELASQHTGGTGQPYANLRVAYKFVSGDTSVTFGSTGSTSYAGAKAVMVFRGVNQSTPMDVTATTATGTGTGNANPPAITPVTAGAVIVSAAGNGSFTAAGTFSSSDMSGMASTGANDNYDTSCGIAYKVWTGGSFDPAQWTSTNDDPGTAWAALTFALRPAA